MRLKRLAIHPGTDDGNAAPQVLELISPEECPRLQVIFGDNKYHNHALHAWLDEHRPDWRVEVKKRPEGSRGFTPREKRLGCRADQRLERPLPSHSKTTSVARIPVRR